MSHDTLQDSIQDKKEGPWFDKMMDSVSTAFGFMFGGIAGGIAFERTVSGAPLGSVEIFALLGFATFTIFAIDWFLTVMMGVRAYLVQD